MRVHDIINPILRIPRSVVRTPGSRQLGTLRRLQTLITGGQFAYNAGRQDIPGDCQYRSGTPLGFGFGLISGTFRPVHE